jgi:hypothetical protein
MADFSSTLSLSADDLRQLTKWPDSVIIEFLSLQSGVQNVTENINIVINNTDMVLNLESQSAARVAALSKELEQLREITQGFDAVVARLSAKITTQAAEMSDLIEQASAANNSLLARLNREISKREDLEQELMARH